MRISLALLKGAPPGHEFYGNQYVDAGSLNIEVYSKDKVKEYVQRIKAGEDVGPVLINEEDSSWVVDGNHRAAAFKELGRKVPVVHVPRVPALLMLASGKNTKEVAAELGKADLEKEFLAPTSATSGLASYSLEGQRQSKLKAKRPTKMLTSIIPLLAKGDYPNHPFRGNQWTDGRASTKRLMGQDSKSGGYEEELQVKELGAMLDFSKAPITDVTVRDLIPTQPYVFKDVLERKVNVPERPPEVLQYNGRKYVIDGHHRIAAASMKGERVVAAHFFNADVKAKKWDYSENTNCCPKCGVVSLSKAVLNGKVRTWVLVNEQRLQSVVTAFLHEWAVKLGNWMGSRMGKTDIGVLVKAAPPSIEKLIEDLLKTFDPDIFGAAFIRAIRKYLEEAFTAGVGNAASVVGMSMSREAVSHYNVLSEEYSLERGAELVGKQVRNGKVVDNPNASYSITDTTREDLRALIGTAVREGQSAAALQQSLIDSYSFSVKRAMTIARTELAFANVRGNLKIYQDWGMAGKSSILADTHPEYDECDENEAAGIIPLMDTFPSGDIAPPYHPNCLCDIVAYAASEMPTND